MYTARVTWHRRSVLRALGTSAFAPLVVPLVQACSAGRVHVSHTRAFDESSLDDIRQTLREVVPDLSQRFAFASGQVTIRRLGRALTDAGERRIDHGVDVALVLSVSEGGRRFEQVATDPSPQRVRQAAKILRERASAGYRPASPAQPLGRPRDFASTVVVDPGSLSSSEWLPRVDHLYQRSKRVGGSRIVYRGSYLLVDDRVDVFVGAGRDMSQRLVRTRSGVVLIAQRNLRTGSVPVVEVAERHGLLGLEATSVPLRLLESAADRVLAMVSPSAYDTGEMDLLCDPSVASLFVGECVGRALTGSAWLEGRSPARAFRGSAVASEHITLIDDPSVHGAYGSYFFDDEGRLATPSVLIDKGQLKGPVTDRASASRLDVARTANGRRSIPTAELRTQLSNTALVPGLATREQLIAGVDRGLLLEGGLMAHIDPRTWRFSIRVARAHEIRGGKTTGVLYGNVDVRGDVPSFLQSARAVSSTVVRSPARSPTPTTVGSPFLLSRAEVV